MKMDANDFNRASRAAARRKDFEKSKIWIARLKKRKEKRAALLLKEGIKPTPTDCSEYHLPWAPTDQPTIISVLTRDNEKLLKEIAELKKDNKTDAKKFKKTIVTQNKVFLEEHRRYEYVHHLIIINATIKDDSSFKDC